MTKKFLIIIATLVIGISVGLLYSHYQRYLSKSQVHTITYPTSEEDCDKTINSYRQQIMRAYDSEDEAEYKRLNDEAEKITNHCLNLMSN